MGNLANLIDYGHVLKIGRLAYILSQYKKAEESAISSAFFICVCFLCHCYYCSGISFKSVYSLVQ